jgi:hypothetical protein
MSMNPTPSWAENSQEFSEHDVQMAFMKDMREIKSLLIQQANKIEENNALLEMVVPKKVSLSYLVECTGKTRQAMREFIMNNYNPTSDFWKEGGKIFVSRNVATAVLKRGA